MSLYKFLLLIVVFLSMSRSVDAQLGCTDPSATNYNAAATINDGSCLYPLTSFTPALRSVLPDTIHESSGLVFSDGKLWTHNDSSDPNEIFNIDTATGLILQTLIIDNYPNIDWEDITADTGYIYIGDFGNNHGTRTDLKILKIKKTDIGSGSRAHVNAQAISFSYSDQTSFVPGSTHNFDCESLISIGDSLYIFTKDRGDLQTRVYKMPKTPGTYSLVPYTSFNVAGLMTGADYDPISHEVILIGYLSGHTNSFLWFLNDFHGDQFFSGNKRRIEIGNMREWQTEGVCFISGSRFFISCETTNDINASLFVGNQAWLNTTMTNSHIINNTEVSPNPASNFLYINNIKFQSRYCIRNILGQLIQTGDLSIGNNQLSLRNIRAGRYLIQICNAGLTLYSAQFIKNE